MDDNDNHHHSTTKSIVQGILHSTSRAKTSSLSTVKEVVLCQVVNDNGELSDTWMYMGGCHHQTATTTGQQAPNSNNLQLDRTALQQPNHHLFIEYSNDWIMPRQQQQQEEQTVLHDIDCLSIPNNDIANLMVPPSEELHERLLTITTTTRNMQQDNNERVALIVRVSQGLTMDNTTVYNYIFGSEDSLQSQLEGCTSSQMTIVPYTGTEYIDASSSIIELTLPEDPSSYTFFGFFQELANQIRTIFGLASNASIQNAPGIDEFIFLVPDGIRHWPSETAWAPIGGFYMGVLENWFDSIQNLMHEYGHNLGLAHAYENNAEYADGSSVMGYTTRSTHVCFNGQNMYSLGLFSDQWYQVTPSTIGSNDYLVDLAFYGDYEETNLPVMIMINPSDGEYDNSDGGEDGATYPLFLTFNRNQGYNYDVIEYPNTVLIIEERMGNFHAYSNLIEPLPIPYFNGHDDNTLSMYSFEISEYFENDEDLIIEVCSYTPPSASSSSGTVEYVTLSIYSQPPGGCLTSSLNQQQQQFVNSNPTSTNAFGDTVEVSIIITFDDYPTEVYWSLIDMTENETLENTFPGDYEWPLYEGETVEEVFEIPSGHNMRFIIRDTGRDGLCCRWGNGVYSIIVDDDWTVATGGEFPSSEEVDFVV